MAEMQARSATIARGPSCRLLASGQAGMNDAAEADAVQSVTGHALHCATCSGLVKWQVRDHVIMIGSTEFGEQQIRVEHVRPAR
eukprot:99164-Prymnesium_polylepis.2